MPDAGPARRRANRRSAGARWLTLTTLAVLMALALAATAGWLWINREQKPTTLTVGAGPYGSDSYVLMRHVADVVSRHSKILRLDVIPTRDPSDNIALLNQRKIDLAAIRADTPVVADVRLVAGLFQDFFQIVVRDDAPVYGIPDLANARIAIPPFGTDSFRSYWVIGDHYDLSPVFRTWEAVDFPVAAKGLLNGQYQAIFTVRSLRDERLLRLFQDAQLKGIGLRFLPIDQAPSIALKRPFLEPAEIPAGAFTGSSPVPRVNTATAAVQRILVTRVEIPEEAIRELTAIMFEHRLDLTIRFSLAAAISKPDESGGLNVPLHDGAAAFYDRDKPSFIQENAEVIALGVTLLAMAFSGLLALRRHMSTVQKNRADVYNYELLDLKARVAAAASHAELQALRKDLDAILERIVVALDTDEVTDEGFQSFSLLWQTVRESILERRAELKG